MIKNEIINLIKDQRARVGVIGLGYVGLPLLTEFAGKGFNTVGFEVDERKASQINAGQSYIGDVTSSLVKEAVDAGRLRATTDFDRLQDCDAIIICVPTPLRKTKEPDVSFILAAAEETKRRLRRGQLLILDATTYPRPTDTIFPPTFRPSVLIYGFLSWPRHRRPLHSARPAISFVESTAAWFRFAFHRIGRRSELAHARTRGATDR